MDNTKVVDKEKDRKKYKEAEASGHWGRIKIVEEDNRTLGTVKLEGCDVEEKGEEEEWEARSSRYVMLGCRSNHLPHPMLT